MFSGLNLGILGPSRLRIQIAAGGGDRGAQRILELRKDFHLLLATILWGNVAANTLLALLADSILTGVVAFAVSTVGITLFGEVLPQAYVARHAYVVASALAPLIRLYRTILLPVAWPTARMLDALVGKEGLGHFREVDLREMLRLHILEDSSDVSHVEGRGALNFLALDDRHLHEEAEPLHPESILSLPFASGRAQFPAFEAVRSDPFLDAVHRSRHMWVVITDPQGQPRVVLNANTFLRAVLMEGAPVDPVSVTFSCARGGRVANRCTRISSCCGPLTRSASLRQSTCSRTCYGESQRTSLVEVPRATPRGGGYRRALASSIRMRPSSRVSWESVITRDFVASFASSSDARAKFQRCGE
jgi:hypothetical protein